VSRRVLITGVGAVTPLGVGAARLLERWAGGDCGIEEGVGRCDEYRPEEVLSKKELRRTDRFVQLATGACAEALEHAGWGDGLPLDPERVGCIIGTGIGGLGSFEEEHTKVVEHRPGKISAFAVPLMMANAATAGLAMRWGLGGPAFSTVSACAAGADALGTAARLIRAGDVDAMLAGGAEATLTPLATAAFAKMGATSESGISRPFDRRRDGFVMGEGAAVLVLESEESVAARGATAIGELLGHGGSADAYHLTIPEPSGAAAAHAIERALADAGLAPADVDYVNAHGTSTPLNDRSETSALKAALGAERAREVPVSSTKSAIGHLLGAAGAVEAVATLLALRERLVPPTVGWEERDEGLDLDYVPGSSRPLVTGNGRAVAISNSFGFGGHNSVLVLAA
jgi:3-oxoacyl-[acyl-carrier-protein] synthase II